ncbi:hypothetical protein [cf. Phormidesmis sp. LEGE 11477]|uniref:hypothetical protein n=1 Tax=cf. Phormidesmis sp. LEGE 11477 TaxID=1828680 RepID=UPI0018827315|nr:hypothetical protein [cf. Phormidesmis sp. LEGE 11477]MBE9060932.1 hypothetical protein [cf. Phormidesmis sp. LEGE 11477]
MATSFQEFRTQYPQGSLITDLISIYDGQFVVRASILVEGEPIATGLAMRQSVEAAEDEARDRALALLGISALESSASSQQPNQLKTDPSEITEEETSQAVSVGQAETKPLSTSENDQAASVSEEEPALVDSEDLGPPIDDVVEQPLSASEQEPSMQAASTPSISAAAIALENFNTSALPVDLSDVIAQTDVELRRLGWTSAQGREYLEKTYGKRSRQQLTDDELMSFLLYLEEQ